MLRVVLPVSAADLHLATALIKRLAVWKLFPHVVCQWKDQFDIRPLAPDEFTVIPDVPEAAGWPDAANHMFAKTAELMAGSAFYFMEADCFPLRPDFLAALTQEYEEVGKPYMGALEPSRWTSPDGKYFERGKHMVGTGIYPKDFLSLCTSIHHVERGVPWDVYIEDEVVPECHETKLIHHAWGTAKYMLINGLLTCKDHVVRPGKHSYARAVPAGAAVIHGCKDLSLYDIDLSGY